MLTNLKESIGYFKEFQYLFAILIGALTQVVYTSINSFNNYIKILLSSIFIGMTIVPTGIEYFCIPNNSLAAISIYSLSSLISVKLIVFIDSHLPKLIIKYVKKGS